MIENNAVDLVDLDQAAQDNDHADLDHRWRQYKVVSIDFALALLLCAKYKSDDVCGMVSRVRQPACDAE